MNRAEIIRRVEDETRILLAKSKSGGHDFSHTNRVRIYAKIIAKSMNYDLFKAELAALLHDIGNSVQREKHGHYSAKLSNKILSNHDISENTRKEIITAVEEHDKIFAKTLLGKILQDADKLDSMGPIGIMRMFEHNLGKLPLYNPRKTFSPPRIRKDSRSRCFIHKKDVKYISDVFYMAICFEKMLNFRTSKIMAREKIKIMKDFIRIVKKELSM